MIVSEIQVERMCLGNAKSWDNFQAILNRITRLRKEKSLRDSIRDQELDNLWGDFIYV